MTRRLSPCFQQPTKARPQRRAFAFPEISNDGRKSARHRHGGDHATLFPMGADAAELVPENMARLFACLASARITLVTVTFDGYGDSGQIEDIAAFIGDLPADLPGATVEVKTLHHGADQPVANCLSASEAIENLAYDLLRQTHCGWENNDGAYGEFTFDVAVGTITLDYNERFTSSENYAHEW